MRRLSLLLVSMFFMAGGLACSDPVDDRHPDYAACEAALEDGTAECCGWGQGVEGCGPDQICGFLMDCAEGESCTAAVRSDFQCHDPCEATCLGAGETCQPVIQQLEDHALPFDACF
jgi:hypothetical protein